MARRRGAKIWATRERRRARDKRQDTHQRIEVAAAAIERSGYFNICYLNPAEAAAAARHLARTAVRALNR